MPASLVEPVSELFQLVPDGFPGREKLLYGYGSWFGRDGLATSRRIPAGHDVCVNTEVSYPSGNIRQLKIEIGQAIP